MESRSASRILRIRNTGHRRQANRLRKTEYDLHLPGYNFKRRSKSKIKVLNFKRIKICRTQSRPVLSAHSQLLQRHFWYKFQISFLLQGRFHAWSQDAGLGQRRRKRRAGMRVSFVYFFFVFQSTFFGTDLYCFQTSMNRNGGRGAELSGEVVLSAEPVTEDV